MNQAILSATGLYTPPEAVSNAELVAVFNQYVDNFNTHHAKAIEAGEIEAKSHSSAAFIEKASGIRSRHVVTREGILDPEVMHPLLPERANDEMSVQVEMAFHAAQQALDKASCSAKDIDAVLVACSNMQRPYPAMAIELQAALGIEGFAYDLNVACSSATFGLQAAVDMIKSGRAQSVLVVNPEICTGHLNFCDRDSHFIFGDACTAMIIQAESACRSAKPFTIVDTYLKTQYSNNIRNNGGFLNRTSPSTRDNDDKLFIQQGRKVFKEVVPLVIESIALHLHMNQIEPQQLKRLWLHQANQNMNRLIAHKLLGYEPDEKLAPVILDEYANTSSAGSVIAFHQYHADLQTGDLGVLSSFGAGYSFGSAILQCR